MEREGQAGGRAEGSPTKVHLLLFAWHALGYSIVEDVQMSHIDQEGFRITVSSNGRCSDSTYLFKSQEKSSNLEITLNKIFQRYESMRWPPQGTSSIILWIVLILAATPHSSLATGLGSTKNLIMNLMQTDQVGQTILAIVFILHLLEAVYVAVITAPLFSTPGQYITLSSYIRI
jgi:hypothetical protein